MANTETSQLAEVITHLKSLNLSGERIMDAIDDNNKLVTRSLLIGAQAEGERVDNGGQLLAVVTSLRRMVSDISRSNKELLEFFTSNDMQQEENRRDLLAALRGRDKEEIQPKEKKKKKEKDGESGLAGILAFAAGLIGGTVVGFVSEVAALFGALIKDANWIKSISQTIAKIQSNIVGIFVRAYKAVSAFLDNRSIIGKFARIGNQLRSMAVAVAMQVDLAVSYLNGKLFKPLVGKIQQIGKAWTDFAKALSTAGKTLSELFNTAKSAGAVIGESATGISKFFSGFSKFFGLLSNTFGMFFQGFQAGLKLGKGLANVLGSVLKALGPLMKVIALPLLIITSLIAAIIGFVKGFKEDGIIGGIKGAIVGIFDALIGGLLDMIKGAVSWIASMLGFDNVSKVLDSFSFSQLFKDGVDAIFDTVIYAFDWFKSIFSFEKFSKAFENFNVAGIWLTIVSGILDTLKGAFSWIATMFGAFDIANVLDSFSFADVYKSVFDAIGEAIDSFIHWIMNIPSLINELTGQMGQAIDGALSGIGNLAEGFAKSVLRDVLPDPSATGMLNPMSWVAKAIPDSIYEYAGLKAGGKEMAPGAVNGKMSTGEQLSDGEKSSRSKPVVTPITNTTGAELLNSSNTISISPVIVNNYGGNTTNTTQSSVNNTNSSYDPIMTGSAMGFASV
jgi:hypothetical protein